MGSKNLRRAGAPHAKDITLAKAKIDDITHRRCEASKAMGDRLHAAVVEYKRADQSFVNEQ